MHHECTFNAPMIARVLSPTALIAAAEAAEFPARRRAAGASFRSQPTPSDYHVGRGSNMNRHSVPMVQRSEDSPRDVHNPRDIARQSVPASMRRVMSRSRSRDRGGPSNAEEEQAGVRSHALP